VEKLEPTLLFIHGAGGNHRLWEYQLNFFQHAIAVDLAGHDVGAGKSTIDEYVEEVKRFCDENGLRNIVMIGHSMGGAIAQKFALDYQEYLKAIVLVCTGAKLRVAPSIFGAIRENHAQAIELITEFVFCDKAPTEIRKRAAEEMMKISPDVIYGDFEACDKFSVMSRLKEIKLPTLIICGLDDQVTPVKYSEYLKNNIPNSRLEIIADAGHMVMLERPKEFNQRLEKFIKELCSPLEKSAKARAPVLLAGNTARRHKC
jgi:pimeloyl-ACP methyl ester carboxylesterase